MSSVIFEEHTESSRNLVGHILQLCMPNKSDICILYVCAVMDDETVRKPVYYSKSPSWPGMCISIDLSCIK